MVRGRSRPGLSYDTFDKGVGLLTATFWRAALERAVKTGAQTAAALLAVDGVNLLTLDWQAVGATTGLAVVLSVLTSIGSAGIGPVNSPSLVATAGRHAKENT